MKPRLEQILLTLAFMWLALLASYRLIAEGFTTSSILSASLFLAPLLLVAMLAASRWWVALTLGGIGLTFSIPLPLIRRLECGMVLVLLIAGLVLLRSLFLAGKTRLFAVTEDRLMAVVAFVVLARIYYDRPGSAASGATGGLAEAFYFGLGVVAYFIMVRLISNGEWSVQPTMKVIGRMLVVTVIVLSLIATVKTGWALTVRSLFGTQVWFLSAMAMSWALLRARRPDRGRLAQLLPYIIMGTIMILSMLTPYRSRPVFAVAIMLAVAYVHGSVRRIGSVAVAGLGLVVTLWLVAGSAWMPFVVTRSLSTIIPMSRSTAVEYASRFDSSAEFGWQSEFRAQLNNMAWERIKSSPVIGKGFSFTRDELLMQVAARGSYQEQMSSLAVSGVYHNAIVELAVFCGLPIAFVFVLAYLLSLVKSLRFARGLEDPVHQFMAASLIGFLAAESGQLLMNGSGRDFYYICLLLGTLRGLRLLVGEQPTSVAQC